MDARPLVGPVPTGPWGRAVRPPAPSRRAVDLRDADRSNRRVPSGGHFRPVPPPPPPPTKGRQGGGKAWSVGRRRGLELLAGLVFLGVVSAWGGGRPPAPLDPQSAWAVKASASLDALAADVAAATSAAAPTPAGVRSRGPVLSSYLRARLEDDVRRAEAVGPPPDLQIRTTWRRVLHQVSQAASALPAEVTQTRSALELAALELTEMGFDADRPY